MGSAAGPLVLLGAAAAGVAGGDRAAPGPARALLIVATVVCGTALALPGRLRLVAGAVGVGLLAGAVTQRAHDGVVHSPLAPAVDARVDATIAASLTDEPDGGRFAARVLVRVQRLDVGRWSTAAGDRTVLVTAGGDAASRLRLLSAGDRVVLVGWFQPLTGTDRRMRWRHAVAHFDAVDLLAVDEPRSPFMRIANRVRGIVVRGIDRLPPTERGLLGGFLLGDTRAVPPAVEADFRAAGLTHLLAVSGANVAFVLALAGPVLRRLGLRGRLAGGAAVLVLFGTMTRWEPSVLRACAMAACSMLALYLGRPAAGLRVLALAALALLLADPFLLHSVGFLLSCGACGGIAVLGPPITRRLFGPRWLREGLGVTAAAQLGVAPVILPVFGSLPAVALPANLVAVPLAAPLTVWGMPAAAAGGVIGRRWPGMGELVQAPTVLLVRAIRTVAEAASTVPLAVDARLGLGLAAGAAATAAVCLARRRGTPSTLRRDGEVPSRRARA